MQRRTNRESCFSELGPNLDVERRREVARIAAKNAAAQEKISGPDDLNDLTDLPLWQDFIKITSGDKTTYIHR